MSMNIKKGDKVVVLNTRRQKDKNGKPKTVTGKVLAVIPEKEQVIVEGYNMVSKHKKPKGRTEQGGIVKKEAPIHVSNVMVVCPIKRLGHDSRKVFADLYIDDKNNMR